jgi:hypothetical protein
MAGRPRGTCIPPGPGGLGASKGRTGEAARPSSTSVGGEFPANAGRVRKNNRCDIFARLRRGRSLPSLSELSRLLLLWSATPPRPVESLENDEAATLAVSKRLESSRITLQTFPLVGGVYNTREAVHAE